MGFLITNVFAYVKYSFVFLAVVPQPISYNRPPSLHQPDLYADAYAALGRGAYEATARATNDKV